MWLSTSSFIFTLLFSGLCYSAENFLYVPPGRNGFEVYPASFEYEVKSNDTIQIGTRKITSHDIQFDIAKDQGQSPNPNFSIVWPSQFFSKGEISILDGLDRALWSRKVNLNRRTTSAKTMTVQSTPGLLQELTKTPFFRFCASAESDTSHLQVCTRTVSLSRNGEGYSINLLNQKKNVSVTVNGKPLGAAGLIPLESPSESVRIEIETPEFRVDGFLRKPDFDFYHILVDGNNFLVYVRGADPEIGKGHEELAAHNWILHLSKDRTRVYLYDDSQIPMAVEIAPSDKKLPSQNIEINHPQGMKTYGKSTTVKGDGIDKEISLLQKDDVPYGVDAQWEGGTLHGRFDASAYKSMIADGGLVIPGGTRGISAYAQAQKWFYPMLGISGRIEQRLYTRLKPRSYDIYEFSTLHRWNGFIFQNPGMGMKLNFAQMTVGSDAYTLFGLGFFAHQRAISLPHHVYDWHDISFDYYPDYSGTSSPSLTSIFGGRIEFYRFAPLEKNYYKLGVGFRNWIYDSNLQGLETLFTIGYGIYQ